MLNKVSGLLDLLYLFKKSFAYPLQKILLTQYFSKIKYITENTAYLEVKISNKNKHIINDYTG